MFDYSLASHPEHVILPNPDSVSEANEIRNEESLEYEFDEEEVKSIMTEHIEEEKQ